MLETLVFHQCINGLLCDDNGLLACGMAELITAHQSMKSGAA